MKAKLLVSTAFLAASVSLSAQKSATITVHADQGNVTAAAVVCIDSVKVFCSCRSCKNDGTV